MLAGVSQDFMEEVALGRTTKVACTFLGVEEGGLLQVEGKWGQWVNFHLQVPSAQCL